MTVLKGEERLNVESDLPGDLQGVLALISDAENGWLGINTAEHPTRHGYQYSEKLIKISKMKKIQLYRHKILVFFENVSKCIKTRPTHYSAMLTYGVLFLFS